MDASTLELALAELNADAATRRRLRFADIVFVVAVGAESTRFVADTNGIRVIVDGRSPAFVINVDGEAWSRFASAAPPPGFQDVSSMAETGRARVTGSFVDFVRYLNVVRDVMAQLARGSFH